MAKKNRKRNHMIAAAQAAAKAAAEQELPPPPAAVTPIEAVAATTEGVREQQLGMYAEQTALREDEVLRAEQALQAQIDAFNAEQKKYQDAYASARTDEERGAVLAGERGTAALTKLAVVLGVAYVAAKVLR